MALRDQPNLFDDRPPLPKGFRCEPNFLTPADQRELVRQIEVLPFENFQFHGFVGNRRVVSFGWRYDFNDGRLQEAEPMPGFLLPVRERAAAFAQLDADDFRHVLVTEYAPGAGIGWHRDKAVFDKIVGISLLAPCDFRLRRRKGSTWERVTVPAAPGSAYLLSGPARTEWEHSIPEVEQLRYSITFRNFLCKD